MLRFTCTGNGGQAFVREGARHETRTPVRLGCGTLGDSVLYLAAWLSCRGEWRVIDFYGLPLGADAPEAVNAVIEIPKGSRNKYEYDSKLGVFRLDRVLSTAMMYTTDYGFLPRTLAGDGDPVDVLVLMDEPTFSGCVMTVRPVGLLKMDDKGEDFKVLAVPVDDKRCAELTELSHVPAFKLREIEHFFATYKDLEGAQPTVEGWTNAAEAKAYIMQCAEAYRGQVAAARR